MGLSGLSDDNRWDELPMDSFAGIDRPMVGSDEVARVSVCFGGTAGFE